MPCPRLGEAAGFFVSSLPIALVDFVKLLLPAITTAVVGHHGTPTDLAGASLGILAFNIAGQMIATAPIAALDTIAPQAYGAGHVQGVGLAAQRAVIIAALFCLPTAPLWLFARPLLEAFEISADVCEFAARYMLLLLPGLPPLVLFEVARKFVYAQELRWLPLHAAWIGLPLHWLWLWLGCGWLGVGVGAPLALSATYVTMASILCLTIRFDVLAPLRRLVCAMGSHRCNSWLERALAPHVAMRGWPRGAASWTLLWHDRAAWVDMLATSAAALVSLSEWLFWELTAFRVGRLGTAPLATYSCAYSLEPVFFMLPIGLSTGLSASIGNHLGAHQVGRAKALAVTGLTVGYATVLAYVALVFLSGDALARLFSTDEGVLASARAMWPWFCLFMCVSGPFALQLGLNRGLGLQRQNAICVVGVLWPLGAPLVLGWATDVSMIWQALTITYTLLLGAMALCASCASWERLALKAVATVGPKSDGAHSDQAATSHTQNHASIHARELEETRTVDLRGLAAADAAATTHS